MKNEKLSKRCSLCGGIKIEKRWRMCEKCRKIGRLNKRKHRKTPVRELNCVVCGRKIKTTYYNKKTCSKKCSKELGRRHVRKWQSSPKGKEYVRTKMREYARSEKGRKKHKEYHNKHRKERNAWRRNYQKTSKHFKEYLKNYREKNREKLRVYHRDWIEKK